ncbi:Uncharacterised protein [uncultured archaeon]|nr:Uncharacterised protein [uncultured archaeon]
MNELKQLFDEEEKIQRSVREISQGVLDLSDYALAKSPIELAEAEVVGKRIRRACDVISDEVHRARQKLGDLMTHATKVKFKKSGRELHDMENELSLIHGDLEAIGRIAEEFYKTENRKASFANINRHYSELMQHITSLMISESNLKELS